MSHADRLWALFQSNQRSMGRFSPASGKMFTEYRGPTVQDFEVHLVGKQGIGCVPIQDDDNIRWAVIDIDNHGSDADIPIVPVDEAIIKHQLPLIACRSKSGGIHCYLFLAEKMPAGKIRALLEKWTGLVGHPGSELYPKQTRLTITASGKQQLGNWVNSPYMGGDKTERYAFKNGQKLSLEDFLKTAEKMSQTAADLSASILVDHPQAPPCIQKMMAQGVGMGMRNEGMYNATVYLRKLDPDGFQAQADQLNKSMFDKPLSSVELKRTVTSAGRPDYGYRCNEEPIRSLCDREACLKRKFGITSKEMDQHDVVSALPKFDNLVQILTDPPRWDIKIDGVSVKGIDTETLMDFRDMRRIILERLLKVVPLLKQSEWDRVLQELMPQVMKVHAPDDANPAGMIRTKLIEFVHKADLSSAGQILDERKALLRGMPVVQEYYGDRYVFFRGQDFVQFLKRSKMEELRGQSLWLAIRDMGCASVRFRVGEVPVAVWYIPVSTIDVSPVDEVIVTSEL